MEKTLAELAEEAREAFIDAGIAHDGCCADCHAYDDARELFEEASKAFKESSEPRTWDVFIDYDMGTLWQEVAATHQEAVKQIVEKLDRSKYPFQDSIHIKIRCELSREEFTTEHYFEATPTQRQRALKALHDEDVSAVKVILEEAQNPKSDGGESDGSIDGALWNSLWDWVSHSLLAANARIKLLTNEDRVRE